MNDQLDHDLAMEKVKAGKTKLALFILGVALVIFAGGAIYLASQRLPEPEWIAPVVSGLVGFIAGGAAAEANHASKD